MNRMSNCMKGGSSGLPAAFYRCKLGVFPSRSDSVVPTVDTPGKELYSRGPVSQIEKRFNSGNRADKTRSPPSYGVKK